MADETRTPQTEPAEGSRKVIEHELERQNGRGESGGAEGDASKGKAPGKGPGANDQPESRH